MKKFNICLLLVISAIFLKSQTTPKYSFFSAGHTYGNPNSYHYGLHYPFVEYFPDLNNNPNLELGFFTGDVVYASTAAYWDSAMIDINKLNMPVFFAAGNHDIGTEFVNRFSNYFFSFKHKNDLFIILTPGLDSWNISGNQLDFLINTIDSNYSTVNNIFIMMHELIWWSPNNEYNYVNINWVPHYPGSTNYESVIKPLLLSYPNKITVYAGDLGCTNQVSPFMFDNFNNITLIGSGMGGGVRDNIIITDVYEDSVHYNLIALNGNNPNALGEIYDYDILKVSKFYMNFEVNIYPNPCNEYFNVENNSGEILNLKMYNSYGQMIKSDYINNGVNSVVVSSSLKSGIYYIFLTGENAFVQQKVIVQ